MTVGTVFTTLILLLRTNTLAYYSLMPQIYSFKVKLAYFQPCIVFSAECVKQYFTFIRRFRCKTLLCFIILNTKS